MKALLISLFLLLPSFAMAQVVCGPSDEVLKLFEKKHNETPAEVGRSNDGTMVMLLRSPQDTWSSGEDTWTIVVLRPDYQACPVAAGTGWSSLHQPQPGSPS